MFISVLFFSVFSFAQVCGTGGSNLSDLQKVCLHGGLASRISERLKSSGFSCDSSRVDVRGIHCRGNVEGYPQKVNIYIPAQVSDADLSLSLHFHGYNLEEPQNIQRHFNLQNGDGDYGLFLARSKANSLLVIPESMGNGKDYYSSLGSSAKVNQFLERISSLTETKASKLTLSGHSGAGKVIHQILSQGGSALKPSLKAVGLFDALYGPHENIQKWIREKRASEEKFIFYDSYISGLYPDGKVLSNDMWSKEYKRLLPGSTLSSTGAVPLGVSYYDIPKKRAEAVMPPHMAIMKNGGMDRFLQAASSL